MASEADAAVIITVSQVGGDVVAEASGVLNLTALTESIALRNASGRSNPSRGALTTGLMPSEGLGYSGITSGPKVFGSGESIAATSGTGTLVGIYHTSATNATILMLRPNYVSGEAVDGSAIWEGYTLASLGLEVGTYVWVWGSGENEDSLTINVIPEPASLVLIGLGPLLLAALRRKSKATPKLPS